MRYRLHNQRILAQTSGTGRIQYVRTVCIGNCESPSVSYTGEHSSLARVANIQQRATFVRHQLEAHDMPVADAPDDDDVRQTYNFAPGYHGLVYRADVPDYGAGNRHHSHGDNTEGAAEETEEPASEMEDVKETKYKIQAMKWGGFPPEKRPLKWLGEGGS